MLKKNIPVNSLSFGEGYVIFRDVPETIVGSILEIVEAIGLKDSQEKAVKDIIRQKIYSVFYDKDPVYIKSDLHSLLREKYWDLKKKSNIPAGYLTLEDIK